MGQECGFFFPTEIPHISVGWQSKGWQGHVGRGIPSYQDISDYAKEVEGGSEWKVEGGGRGTSKGRNTLGGYLDITRGVNVGKNRYNLVYLGKLR